MQYRALFALALFIFIAYCFSSNRKAVRSKYIVTGLVTQAIFAILVLKVSLIKEAFFSLTFVVDALQEATRVGSQFVFGYLAGGPQPFNAVEQPFLLAFQALPMIIFMSALSSLLFHWRILPIFIKAFANLFGKTLGVGGALSLGSAANIFFGMDAAPMCIRPYLKEMSQTELFAFMTVGMSTVAGTVMVVYAAILGHAIPDVIGHIISASVINIPAAITFARIMVPDNGTHTAGELKLFSSKNTMDAITKGTLDGVQVFINVIAMLMVLVGLVALANKGLAALPTIHGETVSLQNILGYVFWPIMWLIGIPAEHAHTAGILMGTKTVLNELIAYIDLSQFKGHMLDEHSRLIMVYALCGFANLGSVGIMIGSLGTLVPERRHDVVNLGLKTIVAGTLSTLSTGALVGMLL